MATRYQDKFTNISVSFVSVTWTGCDANGNWGKHEGSENSVPVIGKSVSLSIKLYESHHDCTI